MVIGHFATALIFYFLIFRNTLNEDVTQNRSNANIS